MISRSSESWVTESGYALVMVVTDIVMDVPRFVRGL